MAKPKLYRLNGGAPAPLPDSFTPPDGYTRTHPEQWTPEEIAAWGFVEGPDKPEHDPATQQEARWEGEGWVIDDLPPPPEPPEPVYRSIDKVEAIALLTGVTGMDHAAEIAFRKDPNLELFWIKWREDVGNVIHRNNPLTTTILDVLQQTGYLDVSQRAAVLANWPTV